MEIFAWLPVGATFTSQSLTYRKDSCDSATVVANYDGSEPARAYARCFKPDSWVQIN